MIKQMHATSVGLIREDEDGNTYILAQISAKEVVWKLIETLDKTPDSGTNTSVVSIKSVKT